MIFFKKKAAVEPAVAPRISRGGRNLAILGIGAIAIALITTTISINIYRSTGDIYLDRSRPGFIADKNDKVDESSDSTFLEEGDIDRAVIDQYLEEVDSLYQKIKAYDQEFSEKALSDESLRIAPLKESERNPDSIKEPIVPGLED